MAVACARFMSVTIYDIAREAGVSSSTVARVLRGATKGDRKDSAERAAHIRQIAHQLGYRPNLRARAFSERRTKGVGLLYTRPMVALAPGIMLALTAVVLNLFGDGVRDALDPRARLRGTV